MTVKLYYCEEASSNAVLVTVFCGKEGADLKGKALNLLGSLPFYPHLWSRTLSRVQKNKKHETGSQNEFYLRDGGLGLGLEG